MVVSGLGVLRFFFQDCEIKIVVGAGLITC